MKRYYSIVAHSRQEMAFPEHLVMLGLGRNVVTLMTGDIQAVVAQLVASGVRVDAVHPLDHVDVAPNLEPTE